MEIGIPPGNARGRERIDARYNVRSSLSADLLLSDFSRFVPEVVPCPSLLVEPPHTALDRRTNSRQGRSPSFQNDAKGIYGYVADLLRVSSIS
jgi:hypothetical protein